MGNSNEDAKEEFIIEMEVDLRSHEASKRKLHFFINNKQQKLVFNRLPDRVKFGV